LTDDEKQEQMARDAQIANANNMTIDELFDYICESAIKDARTSSKLFEMCLDTLAKMFPDAEV
jgi:predicted DNA-binding ribbon-helix-helix protein